MRISATFAALLFDVEEIWPVLKEFDPLGLWFDRSLLVSRQPFLSSASILHFRRELLQLSLPKQQVVRAVFRGRPVGFNFWLRAVVQKAAGRALRPFLNSAVFDLEASALGGIAYQHLYAKILADSNHFNSWYIPTDLALSFHLLHQRQLSAQLLLL